MDAGSEGHGTGPMDDADSRLIEAIGAGDRLAFEALVKRYQNPVCNFIRRQLGDRYAAEDLTQEVFIRVLRAAPTFEPRGRVSSWIFKIAYNLSLNEKKRRSRWLTFGDDPRILDRAAPEGENPPGSAEKKEMEEEIEAALQRLPENQRAALLLKAREDMTYSEIATVLSVSVSSVESLLFRARTRMRKLLGRTGQD